MYKKMLDSRFKPDTFTYNTLVAACNREDNLEQALLMCRAPFLEECPQHHGHKGDPRVMPRTCGTIGKRA